MKLFEAKDKFIYISLIVPLIATISLFILSFFFFVIPTCRKMKIESKKEMLTQLTNSVLSMLNEYENNVQTGILTRQEAQSEAISKIRHLRYGKDNKAYFWINDTCPKMVMHPYITELEGLHIDDIRDINGKNIFLESVSITKTNSEGFINYYWQLNEDSLLKVPKISFVKRFTPWEWIIGTGIYVNDIKEEIYTIQKKLIVISLIIISVVIVLLSYILLYAIGIEKKREKIANELKESKENYKILIDNSPDAIVVYDIQLNKFVDVNLMAEKLFCATHSQLINIDPQVFFPEAKPGDQFTEDLIELFKKTLKGEHPVFIRLIKNFEGIEFYCEIRLVKLPAKNGRLIRASFVDITIRKKAEELAKKNEEILVNLNADKDRFFSILAHDLRSPFNAIIGFTELLKGKIHDYKVDQIEYYVKLIHSSAVSTYTLLEDLLLWAGSHSGKLPYKPQVFDFTDVCSDIVSTMNLGAKTKNIIIQNFITAPSEVYADKEMIKTVLRNLISNAIKFTHPNGLIEISSKKELSKYIISVSDNGIGIPKSEIDKLFDAKQKISRTGTANECGTGLGLILCKEFVEKNSGEIWVESSFGTSFKFSIPSANLRE
jgi:PAS domain S-box-containing protein